MDNIDLFGNDIVLLKKLNKKPKTLFNDYEAFVDKFKVKLTTDDCYTPPAIYDCILDYVSKKCDIKNLEILRPFYPGGDYINFYYPKNSIVVDNPPFSIISKIINFYIKNNIRFFLFAPHLTLFSSLNADKCTKIVCGYHIIYENGARIPTSFLSNMFGDIGIIGDGELYSLLKRANEKKNTHNTFPKYIYPDELITVSKISQIVIAGGYVEINKKKPVLL